MDYNYIPYVYQPIELVAPAPQVYQAVQQQIAEPPPPPSNVLTANLIPIAELSPPSEPTTQIQETQNQQVVPVVILDNCEMQLYIGSALVIILLLLIIIMCGFMISK